MRLPAEECRIDIYRPAIAGAWAKTQTSMRVTHLESGYQAWDMVAGKSEYKLRKRLFAELLVTLLRNKVY